MAPLFKSFAALTLLAAVSNAACLAKAPPPTLSLAEVDTSGASPLPKPSGTLKQVLLGVGYQNYSCATTGTYVQNVSPDGAFARLYDITDQVSRIKGDELTRAAAEALETCLKQTWCTPSEANDHCEQCYIMGEAASRKQPVGLHFFEPVDGVQAPNFNMFAYGEFLSAKLAGKAKAPSGAYAGENGMGAVDWLYLVPNDSGRTHGLTSVYRVQTAGGNAPSICTPGGSLSVPYAAEYWQYD